MLLTIIPMSNFPKVKELLTGFKDDWERMSEFGKESTIGSMAILMEPTEGKFSQWFIERVFNNNGGWLPDHPLVVGVIAKLRKWGHLT
jgi:hypothetical protein